MKEMSASQQAQVLPAANSTNLVVAASQAPKQRITPPTFFNRQQLSLFTKASQMTDEEKQAAALQSNSNKLDERTRDVAAHLLI